MSDKKRGMLFILSGPSGSGKDTILEQLAKRDPNVQLSISLTTRRLYPDVVSIFLMPPSMQTLEERLRNRESECEKDIKTRMRIAQDEIGRAHEYDYVVVNDIVDYAVSDICAIIQAENLKAARMNSFVKEVLEHV